MPAIAPLRYLIVICASILLFVWGLPHTIALRNIALFLGAIGSLYFLVKYRPFKFNRQALPLVLVYGLLLWVVVHYCFFTQEPQLQLIELKSLWVRVFCGMLIATAMGVFIRQPSRINNLFILSFFGMSIAIVAVYLFNSYILDRLLTPNEFYVFLFDRNKVGAAFFSTVDLALGCASLIYLFYAKNIRYAFVKSVGVILLMALSLSASVIANSKNGVGIGAILLAIFLITILVAILRNQPLHKRLHGTGLLGFAIVVFSMLIFIHGKSASPGWGNLFYDIQTAVQIDKYQAWRGPIASGGEPIPKNSLGIAVADNTYERYAWIAAGSREALRHPLGYGLINHPSFVRWLAKDGIAIDGQASTHSGWVDLALAFGLPAIAILFGCLLLILYQGLIKKNPIQFQEYLALWISLAVFLAGFVQEITFKHTLEALIFFITFSAACVIPLNQKICSPKCKIGAN